MAEMIAQQGAERELLKQQLEQAALEREKGRTVASITKDVQENTDMVEKAIRTDSAIPSDVKDNLIIEATNSKAVQESAARNMNMQSAKQSDGSIKSQFLDALTFFGPQIIGGLFGAAEGDAGMLAGAEIGGKLRDSYIDYNFKKQDREIAQQRQLAQQMGTNQIISQPFRIKDGSGWAFPRKVLDPTTGQPVVKFYKEDGTEVSSGMVEEPQDLRVEKYQDLKKVGLSQSALKIAEQSTEAFKKIAPVKKELDQLTEVQRLEDLIQSGAPFKGLIESAMAKGLGGEVGNLAVEERQAAAQIVGYRGKLADLEEFLKSEISTVRKEEILKLLQFIKPRIKKRLKDRADRFTKPRAKRYGMDEETYKMYLLDSTGFDFSDQAEPKVDDRRSKMIDRIKAIKARRGK